MTAREQREDYFRQIPAHLLFFAAILVTEDETLMRNLCKVERDMNYLAVNQGHLPL